MRPLSYYDVHLEEWIEFNIRGGQDLFLEVLRNWPEGSTKDEKQKNMMNSIIWEPCNRQHSVHAYNVIAEEVFASGDIIEENMNILFRERSAILVVYNNLQLYIEMSKR